VLARGNDLGAEKVEVLRWPAQSAIRDEQELLPRVVDDYREAIQRFATEDAGDLPASSIATRRCACHGARKPKWAKGRGRESRAVATRLTAYRQTEEWLLPRIRRDQSMPIKESALQPQRFETAGIDFNPRFTDLPVAPSSVISTSGLLPRNVMGIITALGGATYVSGANSRARCAT
jgi:hypothetical protein